MLRIVPVRISAVKALGPVTIPNLLNHGLSITCRAKFDVIAVVLAQVANKNWPPTSTAC